MQNARVILSIAVLFLLSACHEAKFSRGAARGNSTPLNPPLDLSENKPNDPNSPEGPNNSPRPGEGIDPETGQVPNNGQSPIRTPHTFTIGCDDPAEVVIPFERPITDQIEARVQGDICPDSTDGLTVVFLVDFSGSMGPHFDEDIGQDSPGNDPFDGQTCGRYEAAKRIVEKIAADKKAEHIVNVAMIPFSNQAIEPLVVSPLDIEEFKNEQMRPEVFCGYVPVPGNEGHPGAITDLQGIASGTNYGAAFRRTERALVPQNNSQVLDNTVIYFISDGEPTVATPGGRENREAARQTGLLAGNSLRNNSAIKNLTFNALYLGNTQDKNSAAYQNSQEILVEVSGSPDRVRRVQDAEQLANEILNFPGATINLDASRYSEMARLKVIWNDDAGNQQIWPRADEEPDPNGAQLGIQSLHETGEKKWTYTTQPFVLLGQPNKDVENRVWVNIFGESGFRFTTTVRIIYRQTQ